MRGKPSFSVIGAALGGLFASSLLTATLSSFLTVSAPAGASTATITPMSLTADAYQAKVTHFTAVNAHTRYEAVLTAERIQQQKEQKAKALAIAAAQQQQIQQQIQQQAASVPSAGVLTRQQIGALWLGAGGPASQVNNAICIAEAESGGNTQAQSPTSDFGVWQINASNASPSAMLNPQANAREAVALFDRDGWSPWTTAGSCGL